jgi:hypothetical protein
MSRYLPILVAVCLAVTGFASVAQGGVKRHYSHAYYSAAARCGGKNAVGRNVRREGDTLSNGKKVTEAQYKALTATLDSACRPVAQHNTPVSAPAQSQSPTVQSASAGSGLAQCIVSRESGGNPQAVNPNGHSGLGQWDQATWQAQGGGQYASTPLGASRDEQMHVLNNALAHGQSGAWTPYDGC